MTVSNTKLGYGIVDTNYTQGAVGAISDISSLAIAKEVVTQIGSVNLSGDPRVLAFQNADGDERSLVVSYNYDPKTWKPGDPEFAICDPSQMDGTTWHVVATLTHSDWSQLSNPYGVAVIGSNMFVADYDNACIAQIDMTDEAYTQSAALFYQFAAITSGTTAYTSHCAGIGLATVGGNIRLVALFNHSANSYQDYLPSTLAFINPLNGAATYFGPTAANPGDAGLNQNAVGLTVTGGYAYVASYGGPQQGGGNSNSKLQVVNLAVSPIAVGNTFSSSASDLGDFVGTAIFADSALNNAYVLRANYTTDWRRYHYQVYPTTVSNLQTGTSLPTPLYNYFEPPVAGSGYPGVTWLVAAAGSSRVWFVCGDTVKGIDRSNTAANTYDFDAGLSDLGKSTGNPPLNGHLNTAAIVQHGVSNAAVQHPAFASHTEAALKMRKDLLAGRKKKEEK